MSRTELVPLALRLRPGDDLRQALESALAERHASAAFVVSGLGSLTQAALRFAGRQSPDVLAGPLEILTLSGTLSADGAHLHASVADGRGGVHGGHVARGCIVRTTAEVLLALLPGVAFAREADSQTGHAELVVRP